MLSEVAADVLRATLPLPIGPGHVHVYFLAGERGWLAVDTGLGLPDAGDRWRELIAALDAPLAGLVVTHFHPDHVGAGQDVAAVNGAPIWQGALDYQQSERVWGSPDWPERMAAWFRRHGAPPEVADEVLEQGRLAGPLIRYARDPRRLAEGDEVGGWSVVNLPGHADGHIGLIRDSVLIAGDHLLAGISPAVGRYPDGHPDPLGAYLGSLERTVKLGLTLALPGHGEPIVDPTVRARELIEHHARRLEVTHGALGEAPRSAYDVSLELFTEPLAPSERRFAVAETLAHLERLVTTGRAEQRDAAFVRRGRND